MWWKTFFLMLFLLVLFILSRILEAVAYYKGGYLANRLLDPVSISVQKLKAILDQRGVSYTGVIEREELTELVKTSGEVSEGELEVASLALADENSEVVSTNFTCGTHFYEEVEDTKDSVWLVQVVVEKNDLLMRHADWKMFIKKVSRFGVRTGIFHCSLDRNLCKKKKWFRTQLMLAMPEGYRAKDKVTLKSYMGSPQPQAVFDWVNFNLASRIKKVKNHQDLSDNWFHFENRRKREKIRVVLFSTMIIPPMFYSVMSVKFTGRVKFGTVNTDSDAGRHILSNLRLSKVPTYMVLTPESNKTFGLKKGEYLNYHSMALLLRSLHPEVNDIFLLSLIVINMSCFLEFFIVHGSLLKRLGRVLWDIVKWNFLLILLWLPILGLFQLPYMDVTFDYALTALRLVSMTEFAGYVRLDWLWYSTVGWPFPVVTFLLLSCLLAVLFFFYPPEVPPVSATSNGFWNFQWESYLSSLFQPVSNSRRNANQNIEIGMEMLIERLAVPNLWLHPMIPSQYIHDLPVWKHFGPCIESDIGSDSECPRIESDGEENGSEPTQNEFGPKPLMFICEKCRVLQNNNGSVRKTEQELEQERIESESACAKYLMDGDYKCMCGHQEPGGGTHGEGGTHREANHNPTETHQHLNSNSRRSPNRSCFQSDDEAVDAKRRHQQEQQGSSESSGLQVPPGMIATTECAICLESYKYAAVLCGLPCGHVFHQQCIMGWLTRDNHQCPVCRWPAYKAKPCIEHLHAE